jgi:hypothetical protein
MFKAACLQILDNFHEKFENVLKGTKLSSEHKKVVYTNNSQNLPKLTKNSSEYAFK